MRRQPNLNRLRYFVATVGAGSFTAAADRLGVAKTVVSHQVAQLEAELQVTLLKRTTRKLHLTEAGRQFYDRAVAILLDADDAFAEVARGSETPNGTLSVTAPIDYGQAVVAPAVAEFVRRFRGVGVELKFDDALLDLIDADVDVAIRLGWLADSTMLMRRLGGFRQLLVCSPVLVESAKRALSPTGLDALPWVGNRLLRHPLDWTFENGGEAATVTGTPAIMADKTPTAYACILAGAGIGVLPDFVVWRDLAEGRLLHLLPEWTLPDGGIYAVYPEGRYRAARVRRFIEVLSETEQRRPGSRDDN